MRRILKRHEVVPADEWRLFGEDVTDADPVIVPLAELRKDTDAWLARSGRLGVRLAPSESLSLPSRLALLAARNCCSTSLTSRI